MKNNWLNWKYKGAKALKMKQKTGIILRRSVETDVRPQNRVVLAVLALLLAAAWIGGFGSVLGLWQTVSPWAELPAATASCCGWTVLCALIREMVFVPGALTVLLLVVSLLGG